VLKCSERRSQWVFNSLDGGKVELRMARLSTRRETLHNCSIILKFETTVPFFEHGQCCPSHSHLYRNLEVFFTDVFIKLSYQIIYYLENHFMFIIVRCLNINEYILDSYSLTLFLCNV
jgi:hypothetical protein